MDNVIKPTLKHWKSIQDFGHNSAVSSHRSVRLNTCVSGYGFGCTVYPGGRISLKTSQGGGQGEGSIEDIGRTLDSWKALINEAQQVIDHYWGKGE